MTHGRLILAEVITKEIDGSSIDIENRQFGQINNARSDRKFHAAEFKLAIISIFTIFLMLSTVIFSIAAIPADTQKSEATAAPSSLFSRPVAINFDSRGDISRSSPCILYQLGGTLFTAWHDMRNIADYDIYVSHSHDKGLTWDSNKKVNDDRIISGSPANQIMPAAAFSTNSGSNEIYLAWEDGRKFSLYPDIYFSKSTDGGANFDRNLMVDKLINMPANTSQHLASIATDGYGTIIVVWQDERLGSARSRIRFATSNDDGATFSNSTELPSRSPNSAQTFPVIAENAGRFFIAYLDNVIGYRHPYLVVSKDGGMSFGSPIRLDNSGKPADVRQASLSIVARPGGGVFVAWEDSRAGSDTTRYWWDIYGVLTYANGKKIGRDFQISDCPESLAAKNPRVTMDSNGTIYAVWTDGRESKTAIRFSYMKAGTFGFCPSMEVCPPGGDMQFQPVICVDRPGSVYIAWENMGDAPLNNIDIYISHATITSVAG